MFETEDEKVEFLSFLSEDLDGQDETVRPTFFGKFKGQTCRGDLSQAGSTKAMVYALKKMIAEKVIDNGFAFVAEAAMTRMNVKSKLSVDTLMEIPREMRPFTVDVIIVTFVHPAGEELWTREINSKRELVGEWKKMEGQMDGRFKDLYKVAKAKYN